LKLDFSKVPKPVDEEPVILFGFNSLLLAAGFNPTFGDCLPYPRTPSFSEAFI
jgi:hypothetical protein